MLDRIFATLDAEKAYGHEILSWRMTEDDLRAIWQEVHDGWQQGKPMPEIRPGFVYEITGRPVTLMPSGPMLARIRVPGLLQVEYYRPLADVC